jgi:hypothetical protein
MSWKSGTTEGDSAARTSQRWVPRAKLAALLFALFALSGAGWEVAMTAKRPALGIVVVDSRDIAYRAHNGVKNHVLLEKTLPLILERRFAVRTSHVDVLRANRNVWPDADTIAASKPDVVILHWSAFTMQGGQCNPDPKQATRAQRGCAQRLLRLIAEVSRLLDQKVSFIIYSRQPTLCEQGFKNQVYLMLREDLAAHEARLERRIGLLAISRTAREGSLGSAQTQADMKAMILAFKDPEMPLRANNLQGICLLSTPS